MRLLTASYLVAVLSLFCSTVSSQKQLTFSSTRSICKTKLVDSSVEPVPTTTKSVTRTKTLRFTTTSTPITRVTPDPITKTTKSTEYTTTTKLQATVTETVTSIVTETQISTQTAPTSTVPETVLTTETILFTTTTPVEPLFTPILDTLLDSGISPAKKIRKLRRNADRPVRRQDTAKSAPQYPKNVKCSVVTKVIIISVVKKEAPTKTITVNPSTTYVTQTTTKTRTSTSYPPNTYTTITSTTTAISTTITTPLYTSTYTSTETILVAVATFYPQCDPNTSRNYATSVDRQKILSDTNTGEGYLQRVSEINTPEQCCIACAEDDSCAATYFYRRDGQSFDDPCNLLSKRDDSCDPANPLLLGVRTSNYLTDNYHDLASNNKCGQFTVAYPE